jgi:transposase InsO family protein
VVTCPARREATRWMRGELDLSERRACRLMRISASSLRYASRRATIEGLRERMLALARERPRYGYRRLHILLRREGYGINHKRVHRLYRLEGLMVRLAPAQADCGRTARTLADAHAGKRALVFGLHVGSTCRRSGLSNPEHR